MVEIFMSAQSAFETMHISRPQSTENFNRFNSKRSLILVILTLFLGCASMCFIPAETFVDYNKAIYTVSSTTVIILITVVLFCRIPDIFALVDEFKNGIEMRRENPESNAIYEKTNKSIEKYCSMIRTTLITFTVYGSMAIDLTLTSFAYFTTGLDDYEYNFGLPIWLPFKKGLCDYLLEFTIEYTGMYYILFITACVMSFFVASCLMTTAYVKDLQTDLVNLNAIDISKEGAIVVRKRIFAFIRLHMHAIHCVSKLVNIYGPMLSMIITWSLITICVSLLSVQIELSKETPDYDLLYFLFLQTIYAFGVILFYCEFGQQLSNRFELLYDDIYQTKWYLLPMDLQRTMRIIIMKAQRPVQLVGFGNIICNRETFQRIVNSSFSYFLIFREFF